MRRQTVLAAVALVVALAACTRAEQVTDEPSKAPERQVIQGTAAELASAPRSVQAACEEAPELEAACPRLLPAVEGRYRAKAFDTRGADYLVLDISFFAPYPQLTERNAPPRFVHVVVKSGDLTEAFAFTFPSPPPTPPEPPERYQDAPITFGRFMWGGREGLLVLAPKYPVGGLDGGHLIFSWTEGQTDVALSLHAWAPLSDAIVALRGIVMSMGVDPTAREGDPRSLPIPRRT